MSVRSNIRLLLTLLLSLASFHSLYAQKEYAKHIMDTLCSPHFDGRGYVNQGDVRAAEFIRDELQRLGVAAIKKHDYFQDYSFSVNTFPHEIIVALDGDTLVPGEEYLVHPYSGTVQGEFDVVEVNTSNWYTVFKEQLDWNLHQKGQHMYALNFTDVEDEEQRARIMQYAYQSMRYFPCIWVEKEKQMYAVGRGQANYPFITIDSADYHSAARAYLKINNKFIPDYQTKNVIGMIPGKKKRKYVVFSAHYDHLGRMGKDTYFPGANDNASGVAMLLSLAKYYQANKPEYSIVFCFFSGEEAGLEGSKYFVEHPFIKLNRIKFVLNIDIMGGASKGITVVNGRELAEAFSQLQSINEEFKLLNTIKSRKLTQNSDHYYFSQYGVPAFFIYSEGKVQNYHDVYDTAENTPLEKFDEVEQLLRKFVEKL